MIREPPKNLVGQNWMEAFDEINKILEIVRSAAKNLPKEKVEPKLRILRTYLTNQPEIVNVFGLKKPFYSRNKSAMTFLLH